MVFGILKDIKAGENRVICTPVEVASVVNSGHTVLVQKGAGVGSGFRDKAYTKAGAPGMNVLILGGGIVGQVRFPFCMSWVPM